LTTTHARPILRLCNGLPLKKPHGCCLIATQNFATLLSLFFFQEDGTSMLDNTSSNGGSPWIDAKASRKATIAATARGMSGRRRLVDPTTCERDYQADELEFMNAMQEYKKSSGRMFPTWSEVLEVVRGLGYEKVAGNRVVPDVVFTLSQDAKS
jgi:hypothetical protein